MRNRSLALLVATAALASGIPMVQSAATTGQPAKPKRPTKAEKKAAKRERTRGVPALDRNRVTAEQARYALANVDEYTRSGGFAPSGALQVLRDFIEQAASGVTGTPQPVTGADHA